MANIVEIEQLSYSYNNTQNPTLSRIDLSMKKGDCLGILGANGAGKTTLISILCGLLPLDDSHAVKIFQKKPSELRELRLKIGLCPQNLAYYQSLTVYENLVFFAKMLNIDRGQCQKKLDEVLEFIELSTHRNKKVDLLSGGMKRKLNLGIALLNSPELLILDEPTIGIDIASRHSIISKLQQLTSKGMSLVYTSHYLEEIEQLCNRLVVLENGFIKFSGLTEDFKTAAQSQSLSAAYLKFSQQTVPSL